MYKSEFEKYNWTMFVGISSGLLAALFAGSGMIFVKHIHDTGLSIPLVTALSFLISGLFFILVSCFTTSTKQSLQTIKVLILDKHTLICGVTGGLFLLSYYYALKFISASVAETLTSLAPIGTYLVMKFVYKENLGKNVWLISILMIMSVYLIIFGFSLPHIEYSKDTVFGFLFILLGILIAAFFKTSQKQVDSKIEGPIFVGTYSILAFISILPFLNTDDIFNLANLETKVYALIIISSIREGFVWFLFFYAVRILNPFHANILQNFSYLFTIGIDYIIMGVTLQTSSYVGIIMLSLTLFLVIFDLSYKKQ